MSIPDAEIRFQVPPERAQLEAQLIRVWQALEPYDRVHHASPTLPQDVVTPESFEAVRLWASLFKEEIDLVHRARNSVTHAQPVTAENLKASVALGERLWELLRTKLTEVGEQARSA